jgi:hypothetical protein
VNEHDAQPPSGTDEPLAERAERRPMALEGFAARDDGTTIKMMVTDLSYDGCGIETDFRFEPGEKVQLSVLHYGAIKAEVRWVSNGRAGLVFEAEAPSAKPQVARQGERVPLGAEVALRRAGKTNFRVRVFDVSPAGGRIEFVERPEIGELVWIKFDGLEAIEARICWVDGFKAGVEYSNAIHPAVFDLLLARLQL